jgi:hypothetical protein
MQAEFIAFAHIISSEAGANDNYYVPNYQREYKWGHLEWDQLLEDIHDADSNYFMGSIICIQNSGGYIPSGESKFEIVDGQQRLTTLSLLLMAIYSAIGKGMADDEIERQHLLRDVKAKLVLPGKAKLQQNRPILCRLNPSSQNRNYDDYKYLLNELGLLKHIEKPANHGNRRIRRAYEYFRDRCENMEYPHLADLFGKINQLRFVFITVENHADAYRLFETLNHRGLPLTAIDIVKNKLIAKLHSDERYSSDESSENWIQMIDAIPESADQERFLRHFYHSFRGELPTAKSLPTRAVRSNVIHIYDKLIEDNPQSLSKLLTMAGKLYGQICNTVESLTKDIQRGLIELNRIGAAPAFQLLLFLFSRDRKAIGGPKGLEKMIHLLCRYFVRRNTTDVPPTRELDPVFIGVIDKCRIKIDTTGKLGPEDLAEKPKYCYQVEVSQRVYLPFANRLLAIFIKKTQAWHGIYFVSSIQFNIAANISQIYGPAIRGVHLSGR